MKIYTFLILVSLILYIQNACMNYDEITVKKEDCFKRQLSEEEKLYGDKYCCYIKYKFGKTGSYEMCITITEEDYKYFDNTQKKAEEEFGVGTLIDCGDGKGGDDDKKGEDKGDDFTMINSKSSYLKLGALALIFLLF